MNEYPEENLEDDEDEEGEAEFLRWVKIGSSSEM
jgi:hypothetical protein